MTETEGNYLLMSLHQQLDKLDEIERRMIGIQLEGSQKLLLAYFGRKYSSFTGWKNVPPFHLTGDYKIISKELFESFGRRAAYTNQKKIVFKVIENLLALKNESNRNKLDDIEINIMANNEKLVNVLSDHGITEDVEQIKRLVFKLTRDASCL